MRGSPSVIITDQMMEFYSMHYAPGLMTFGSYSVSWE